MMKLTSLKKISKYGKYNVAALLRSAAYVYSDAGHAEQAEDSPLWPTKVWPRISKSEDSSFKYVEARSIREAIISAIKQTVSIFDIDPYELARELGVEIDGPKRLEPMAYLKIWDKRTTSFKKKDMHRIPIFLKEDKTRDIHTHVSDNPPRFHKETLLYSLIKGHSHIELTSRGKRFMKKYEIKEAKQATS